jgi:hypothetical protein
MPNKKLCHLPREKLNKRRVIKLQLGLLDTKLCWATKDKGNQEEDAKKKETPVNKLAAAAKFHAKKPAPGADERGNVKHKAT